MAGHRGRIRAAGMLFYFRFRCFLQNAPIAVSRVKKRYAQLSKLKGILMGKRVRLVISVAALFLPVDVRALDFIPTSGNQFWNDNNNWGPSPPQPFPNLVGAAAVLQAPAADLSIDLGQAITIGSLEIMKPVSPNAGNTAITGANALTIDGGTSSLINRAGTGT